MTWYKNVLVLFLTILIFVIYSCNNKSITAPGVVTDTSKINYLKKNFDSLFKIYSRTNEPSYAKDAVAFGDSLANFENYFLNDTNYRKSYVKTLFFYAACLNDLKNYIKSREIFEKYLFFYKEYKFDQPVYPAYARATLANIYTRFGDYKKTALLFEQSIDYYNAKGMEEEIASCNINIAIYLKEFRKYDEAVQVLNKNFTLKKLRAKRKAISCIELADIYTRQNKLPEAGLQIEKAKQFLDNSPYENDFPSKYSTLFQVQGDWFLADYRPIAALQAYRQSYDSALILAQNNLRDREIGKLYIAMGNALEELNFYDSAMQYYNQALYTVTDIDTLDKFSLPLQKDIYAENTIAEALYARAGCIIKSGTENEKQLENAVSCYKLAFETERKLLDAFSYDESRFFMLEQTRQNTEKAIGVCYQLYRKTKNSHWASEAFLFAEHNKAFVLTESVRRNTAASLFLQNDSTWKKAQELQNNLALFEIELGKQHFSGEPDTALVRSLTSNKQKTEEELLAAENSIKLKNPQYSRHLTEERNITAEELLHKTISSGNRLVEYFAGDSAVYLFSAEKDKPPGFYRLPPGLKITTNDFRHFFSDRNQILENPSGYANAANKLYQSLLGPYIIKENVPMLIIPDGFISFIPFDALLTSTTSSTDISTFPFLIKQQETYYAFSCRTLLEQEQNKNTANEVPVAAFAPVFKNKERGLTPLLHSNEELDAIKQLYPEGKFFTSDEATMNSFVTSCSNAAIIHLATHAGSGDSAAFAGIEFFDSTLYLNRIYSMRLKAGLVVLSGCETGTGAVNKTEGLMSLARGFSYAGTKNVIGSLWQTGDNTSAEIFKHFYSSLSTDNYSTALHKAKLAVINNKSVASASPYYWGGYIYIGSPNEGTGKQNTGKLKLIVLISGACLLLLLGFYLSKRKKSIG